MADTYDSLREGTPQWESEQAIVEKLLSNYEAGTRVLDIPVGTGRFFGAYLESGFFVTGIDVSTSMLEKARAKISPDNINNINLYKGDIISLDFDNDAFDIAVCIRFMDWVSTSFLEEALRELARVTRGNIIVYIMTYVPILELKPFSLTGVLRLIRQLKFKFYKFRTRSDSITHNRKDILDIFNRLSLQLEETICIDPIDPANEHWRMGHSRDIYLLRKL